MHMCFTVGHERPAALARISAKSLSGRASFMTLSTSLIGAPDNADSAATISSNFPLLAYSQTTRVERSARTPDDIELRRRLAVVSFCLWLPGRILPGDIGQHPVHFVDRVRIARRQLFEHDLGSLRDQRVKMLLRDVLAHGYANREHLVIDGPVD